MLSTLLFLILTAYQRILSPWLGRSCRFYPSCSSYAKEALVEHGAIYGVWLTTKRLGRCHPFNEGGIDLVPKRNTQKAASKA